MKPSTTLIDRIMKLRMTAAAAYDVGKHQGHSQEDIQRSIDPITHALQKLIALSALQDLPGVIVATNSFEHQAEAYEADAKFLIQKSMDAKHHAQMLRTAVLERMKAQGIKDLEQDGFTATLAGDSGKEQVTFR